MAVISKTCQLCGKKYQTHHSREERSKYCSRSCTQKNIGKTHGLCKSKLFKKWSDMRARCQNPKHKSFKNYGGRGIKVCERWRNFKNFYDDVGEIPFEKAHLDRIDNNGDYEPGNVRWATPRENAQNTRRTLHITYNGEKMCLSEACRRSGLEFNTVRGRSLRYKIDIQLAFNLSLTMPRVEPLDPTFSMRLQALSDQKDS